MGRWLDAAASLFNVCQIRTYRGEPAMRLEGYIWDAAPTKYFELDNYLKDGVIEGDQLLWDYMQLLISQSGSLKE